MDTEVHRGSEDFDCVRRLQRMWAENKLGIHQDPQVNHSKDKGSMVLPKRLNKRTTLH